MLHSITRKRADGLHLKRVRLLNAGKKIVFCTGYFDIFQSGHAIFLNQCKDFGDLLVVGIGRDQTIAKIKGPGRPINPERNRMFVVASIESVDYVTFNSEEILPGNIDFQEVLRQLHPDLLISTEDDPGILEKQSLCDSLGITFQLVPRLVPPELEPLSTSRIIDKINFAYRAPLRIDFAGGWTDVPFATGGHPGCVSSIAIRPFIELRNGQFNLSGYPRGSGLGTSTAVKLLEMISSKTYNAESKNLSIIAENLFELENKELHWAIGRQDPYGIVFGGFHCFEFGDHCASPLPLSISETILEKFRKRLLLVHSGSSRNAQQAVEQVYQRAQTPLGQLAIAKLASLGRSFGKALSQEDYLQCAKIMEENFQAQKQLAPATSSEGLEKMYTCAQYHGAIGGKICGAGGGGAFIFCCEDPTRVKNALKRNFPECFELDFEFEFRDIKKLNFLF